VATLAAHPTDSSTETATGVKVGLATVTATLKDSSTLTDPTKNSATGALTVVDAKCTTPLTVTNPQTSAVTATSAVTGPLCLICGVTAPGNVIDADPTNVATLNATLGVGLPTNEISLSVNSNLATPFPAGAQPGFHITDPTGALLSANVLNGQITVTTLAADGSDLDSSTPYVPGGILPPLSQLLDVTLLGLGTGPTGGAWVSFVAPQPYYGVKVTFSTGLVSALSSMSVDTACATVDLTK
jgi:hypothetical protein